MSKCKKDEVWTSRVNGQYDGEFTIKTISPNGVFTGTHAGDSIMGECKGGRIRYTRLSSPPSYYSGKYSGDDNLRGVRAGRLPMLSKRKQIRGDDEWVGTHTTLASRRKTAASKSGKTKARTTAGRKR